jgi:hypothetical protein
MAIKTIILLVWIVLSLPMIGGAQTSQEVNEANNPLTPKLTINLQDIYIPSYYGLPDSDANTGLLRGTLPHRLFGWPQILRATVPIVTSPDAPLGAEHDSCKILAHWLLMTPRGPQNPESPYQTWWVRPKHGPDTRSVTNRALQINQYLA